MAESVARYGKTDSGRGHFAEVHVHVEPSDESSVALNLTATAVDYTQGATIDIEAGARIAPLFKEGAIRGARFALARARTRSAVSIERITILPTDATPTSVAAAAALAVWDAIGFTPPRTLLTQLDEFVFSTAGRSVGHVPDLTALPGE